MDKRKPKLEKVGCYYSTGNEASGFHFFNKLQVSNGDIFIYNQGVLWKLTNPKEAKKKTVVTKAVVVDEKFLAKHLTPKEANKK